MSTPPVRAESVAPRAAKSGYPAAFVAVVEGRTKRRLGDVFGLTSFGINLTHLAPGAASALLHYHATQDEFLYVLEGHPTLVLGDQAFALAPGECVGFKGGEPVGHQLVNRSAATVTYLEIGDRLPGDAGFYPRDDLQATVAADGTWIFSHKDGTPY